MYCEKVLSRGLQTNMFSVLILFENIRYDSMVIDNIKLESIKDINKNKRCKQLGPCL